MKTIPQKTSCPNIPSFEAEESLRHADAIERTLPSAREAEERQMHEIATDAPRTVIRGESIKNKKKNNKEKKKSINNNQSYAAITDWLNVSFPFYPEINDPLQFFNSFSEATRGNFGGMTDQQRGLHGWEHSFRFDYGGVMFAFGGQRNTAFLSMPGEGCSYITEWQTLVSFLRDKLQARITRWDGAVDDFKGFHSIDYAVDIYKQGSFKQGGRNPNPRVHGNWITQDDLGRTFEVGNRKNGKLIRIYEKGKQLGTLPALGFAGKLNSMQKIALSHGMFYCIPVNMLLALILVCLGYLNTLFVFIRSKNKTVLVMNV